MDLPTDLDVLVERMRDVTQKLEEVKTPVPPGPARAPVLAQLRKTVDAMKALQNELDRVGLLYS